MDQPTGAVIRALTTLGLDQARIEAFLRGDAVVYPLPTEGDPGIAMIHLSGNRVRSGIIEINDIGAGLKDFLAFRARSEAIARALSVDELELFGGAVINPRLESLLIRQGFQRSEEAVPDELGGGTMEILSRVFIVIETEE